MKKVVIIGAGYAGVLTAKQLAKKTKKVQDVDITIIDKNPYHTMLTELHEVAAGRVAEESIRLNIKKIFAGRNVNVALDTITAVDFEARKIIGQQAQYDYDYLVLAAGSQPTYFGVAGARECAFKLWSYDDAIKLRDQIERCFYEAARQPNEALRRALLAFYVVGAGFTGVEMIGELAEYVPVLCRRYKIDHREVSLVNLDVLPKAVPILPDKLSQKVEKRLQKMGVVLKYGHSVTAITGDTISYQKGEQKYTDQTHTVIWAAGVEASDLTNKIAQQLPAQGRGRITVGDYLNSDVRPEVYVVGDNVMFIDKASGRPVPQMVENCEQSSHIAAHNLAVDIKQTGAKKIYQPKFHGVMVSIGGRYGVAHVGPPNRFFSLPSFLAMFAKHFINIIYYLQVLGWNKIYSYLRHEFFTVRNDRSFVGGHFSNKTPSFLLVFLRVWLGAVWLFEGVMKIVEGWFEAPKLEAFFKGAGDWYDSIINLAGNSAAASAANGVADAVSNAADAAAAGAAQAADAVSAASGAAGEAAGTVLFNWDLWGLIRFIFVCGKDLSHATLADYAFKLDIPLMNWFVDNLVLSSDGMQIFMQTTIVLLEILIGLALIGGLFVTLASAGSLVLQFMFICTTGLYLGTFWMIFAAIAVLIGGGRTLGLDYYAMPALARAWAKIPFVKKWYIYHD